MQITNTQPQKMLVVDDEEPIRNAMKTYFTARGYKVDCAQELEEAQALLENIDYEVAIVDLRLMGIGGTEGLDVISSLRELNPMAHIILLTAHGTPAIEAEARRRGVNAVLHKPQRLRAVAQVVSGLMERKLENV